MSRAHGQLKLMTGARLAWLLGALGLSLAACGDPPGPSKGDSAGGDTSGGDSLAGDERSAGDEAQGDAQLGGDETPGGDQLAGDSVVLAGDPTPLSPIAVPGLTQLESFTRPDHGWARIERWSDGRSMFVSEDWLADGRADRVGQAEVAFRTARPASNVFLLYYAPGWASASHGTPVLLVHGSNDDADRAWANPDLLPGQCGQSECPATGLMQTLASAGFAVFAVGFPHPYGLLQHWAQDVANALAIVRARLGVAKVDVVGWSTGGLAARVYAASFIGAGGGPYQGDIRRLILAGTPNAGLDYSFRHGILPSIGVYPECGVYANVPSVHTKLMCYYVLYEHPELTLYTTPAGNFFPNQKQLLARLDTRHSIASLDPDYLSTYEGGWSASFTSYSLGIDDAMSDGSIIDDLRGRPLPAEIQVCQLCGAAATIVGVHNEHTGPSDGVVFVDSCTDAAGLTNVADTVVDPALNHLELTWQPSANATILEWLIQ